MICRSRLASWPRSVPFRPMLLQITLFSVLGELALDGTVTAVAGVLPAAIAANADGHGLICPHASGAEAAWASQDIDVLAPLSLIQLANHSRARK
jgi:predicted ATPase with chaperone activity